MYKLIIIAHILLFTSFTFQHSVPKEEYTFCEAAELVFKKMKSGEELTMKSWEVAEGADVFESKITIPEWSCTIENNLNDFSFAARRGKNEDILVVKSKFAEIRTQLMNCLIPKKITTDDPEYIAFSSGTIKFELAIHKNAFQQYYLNFVIQKPKK